MYPPGRSDAVVLGLPDVGDLLDLLWADGWTVLGPRVVDGTLRHGEIRTVADLPTGVHDDQAPGHFRVEVAPTDSPDAVELFGYAVGPDSWKRELFPARELITREPELPTEPPPRLALFGVRSCDLAALAVHDRVLAERGVVDPRYVARRGQTLVIAVTCTRPSGTCFCASMGTGPAPAHHFDLSLTELLDGDDHRFLARAGSETGQQLLDRLSQRPASPADLNAEADAVAGAVAHMGRQLDTEGLREALLAQPDHPRWDAVADRCLACGNCTLACPTCFCTGVEDESSLADGATSRWRVWDSCFTSSYSYLHGGSVRASTKARYRQWATHKLATWHDQFGTSGCVGCGRCITWCPAGIDLTVEVSVIAQAAEAALPSPPEEA